MKQDEGLKTLIIDLWKRSMVLMQRGPEIGKRLKCSAGNDPICDAFHSNGCAKCPFGINKSGGPGCFDFELNNIFCEVEPKHEKAGLLSRSTPRLEKIMQAYYEFYRDGLPILESAPQKNFAETIRPKLLMLDQEITARHKLKRK